MTPQGELSVQYHQQQKKEQFFFPKKTLPQRRPPQWIDRGYLHASQRPEIWRSMCCLSTDTHTKVTQQINSHRRIPILFMTHLNKRPPRVSHLGSSASTVLHWTDSILKKYSEYYGMSSCILACSHSSDDQNWLQTLGDRNKWPLA